MNYQSTLNYLFEKLPMFQRIGAAAYKANLDNTWAILSILGNPEKDLKVIHIAGTNGKGSVSHMIASILQESGFRTGLFTSPHLKDFRERIKVNGKMILKSEVTQFIKSHRKELETVKASFFEMAYGMAIQHFKNKNCNVVILETGMGGRLDSTNTANPIVSVITNISYDHREFLGDTLQKIAKEKGGIIKGGVPVVIGRHQSETDNIFVAIAKANKSKIVFAPDIIKVDSENMGRKRQSIVKTTILKNEEIFIENISVPLTGDYQKENIATVLAIVEELSKMGYGIEKSHISKGISNVVRATKFLGRYQVLEKSPLIICDTAHNVDGLQRVMAQIQKESFDRLHIVLGVVSDKELEEVLKLFPKSAQYYFCKANIPRGLEASKLKEMAQEHGLKGSAYKSVNNAFNAAKANAASNDLIFVGGSTFTVAEVL